MQSVRIIINALTLPFGMPLVYLTAMFVTCVDAIFQSIKHVNSEFLNMFNGFRPVMNGKVYWWNVGANKRNLGDL